MLARIANRKKLSVAATPSVLVACVALAGCGAVNTRTAAGEPVRMSRDDFAAYAEKTFRYHNRVVNDLITATSFADESLLEDTTLILAEEQMAARCQALNEMVTATIEGRELSFWAKMRLLESVPQCEAASRAVEERIPEDF